MATVLDHLPKNAEIGVGLAILNDNDHFVFFLAGSRHVFDSNELFYAGIGGHLEPGETLLACGRREAFEEIGAAIEYESNSLETVYIFADKSVKPIHVNDEIKPLAVFEMVHPKGSPKCGKIYHIVIYQARLQSEPDYLKLDEVSALITLSRNQVKNGIHRKVTIQQCIDEGATLIMAGNNEICRDIKIFPIGTAEALAYILNHNVNAAETLTD